MRKYWVEIESGEFGYLWATQKPVFAQWVTITVERPDGTIYKASGYATRIE